MTAPADPIEVRDATHGDVDEIVPVHLAAFSGYLNARLGRRYAVAMTRWFVDTDAIALVATLEGSVVGYVLGAPQGYGREITRRNLGPAALGLLKRPRLLSDRRFRASAAARVRALLKVARTKATETAATGASISWRLASMRTPESGVGLRLVEARVAGRQAGAESLAPTVYPDNVAAISLYQAAGWVQSAATPRFLTFTKRLT